MTEEHEQNPIDNDAYVREVHDKGLQFDLRTMSRRRMLTVLGGAGVLTAVGGAMLTDRTAAVAACVAEVESETAGPYPADGSNGVEVRTLAGVVRSDIRHSSGVTNPNYLRGIQATDSTGKVTFTSIYPG